MPSGIQVIGAQQTRRALKQVEGGAADLKELHGEAAELVESEAAPLTPVLTGALLGTARVSGTQAGGVIRWGRAAVPYAGPIIFGWRARNIERNPFPFEAMDAAEPEVLELFETRLDQLIKSAGLD